MQILLAPSGEMLPEDTQAQTKQVIENILAIVVEAGGNIDSIVKVMVYMTHLSHFTLMNTIYEEYFNESKPARGAVQVSALPKGALIAMDAIAVV